MKQDLSFLAEACRVLGSSLDFRATLRTVARLAVPYLADWSVVDLVEEDGSIARLAVAQSGCDADLERLMYHYAPDPKFPRGVSRVISRGHSERIPTITEARLERAARTPEHMEMLRRLGMRSYLCVPLAARGQILGSWMLISTREGRRYTAADQALAEELGARAAMAVDNARMYESARLARTEALDLARRSEFLDRAGQLLSGSLDEIEIVNKIGELAVSGIGDFCSVHWHQPDGTLKRLDTRTADPAHAELAAELHRRFPSMRLEEAGGGLGHVVASGRALLFPDMGAESVQNVARSSELFSTLMRIDPKSVMLVPLCARGRTAGILCLAALGERRFGAVDLALAQDLAGRAALALDNALLYREAAEASRSRDDFIATVSHELRTPLAALLMWAQLLKLGRLGEGEREHAIDAIVSSGRSQSQLIDDLLDVSRFAAGKLKIVVATVPLAPLVESAIDQVSPSALGKKIQLGSELAPDVTTVACDGARLVQVLVNLLSNAIKFTPEKGRVTLLVRRSGAAIELMVRDTGVGISAEFLPQVFDRFRQAESDLRRAHGGLGLGLTIARQIMGLHGGEVVAESAGPGRGATFTVRLPDGADQMEALAEPASAPPAPRGALDGAHVLVVDDDAAILEVVSVMLEGQGARVTQAGSAAAALAAIKLETPQLLLSDIAMPGEDGYALIRKVRASLPNLPAVALSALAREEDRRKALRAGFQDHVAKPVEMDVLISTLARRWVRPAAPLAPPL